ncbi:AfsR/SARP family transcriptional regulator [Streptomyces aureoverticillatus]|uniref:AfsR/SARP family transcriptional regulator n=1 Tax=Streptomyces aureoverticillatus TaxID=66871 RepID=UPI001EF78BF5|nr:BTAD domain-containing putative transcriptional regulator [Streptomyces aureoverticillatus]
MAIRQSDFARLCARRQWQQPAVFMAVYDATARRLGEPGQITARQLHRWRQPDPPCPRPSSQRVLEEMFGLPLEQLGFTLPAHRRHAPPGPDRIPTQDTDPAHDARRPAPPLRFQVLGPVRAWCGTEALPEGRPQERALLTALLLRDGRTATASELIDAIWGQAPPAQALPALRTYASRLRKALGRRTLVSEAGGYAIALPEGALDLALCETYEAQAAEARTAHDPHRARSALRDALALWNGEPLAGVPGPFADAQRSRLAEWRLALLEHRLALDLELGGHLDAVSELTSLTAEHPLREGLRALLMMALYRGGRQGEALGVYADTRRMLDEELGVSPGPELTALHQRVLHADPGLAAPTGTGGEDEPPPQPAHLAQLPAELADFTGRAAAAAHLRQDLLRDPDRVMAIASVRGLGGVGKTTLAVRVAHDVRGHFPGGQLYADLLGQSARPARPQDVLGAFLRALGVPDSALPEDHEERSALYRSTLAGRRVLVLLDNAHSEAQVRPLLPGAPGCAVLITSRARLVAVPGAQVLDLDVMTEQEALVLFARIVGAPRAEAEPTACRDTVAACGHLPLAIRIAAARLVARPAWAVSTLAGRLADERRRLDQLRLGDLAVDASFELGYGQLEATQARAFRRLALPDGLDISLAAAAAVLDENEDTSELLLESLVDTSLLESAAAGRYHYHDLLRLFARDRAVHEDPGGDRTAALSRLLGFYLATACHAYELENPGDRLVEHLAPTERQALLFDDRQQALDWVYSEGPALLACVRQCAAEPALAPMAADVLLVTQDLMESGAYRQTYASASSAVAEEARRGGDPRTEGRARVVLGQVHHLAGRAERAREEAERAHALGATADDALTLGYAPNLLGLLAILHGRHQAAAGCFTQALSAFRADGNRYGETAMLMNLGRAQLGLGQTESAIAASEQSVELWRELGATLRLANGYYALGLALHEAGRYDEALQRFDQGLEMFRESRQPYWIGMTHFRMATAQLAASRARAAAAHAERALVLLRDIGGDQRLADVLSLLARTLGRLGQHERAHTCRQEALSLLERIGSPEAAHVRALLAPVGNS